jgi:hypothetical protein
MIDRTQLPPAPTGCPDRAALVAFLCGRLDVATLEAVFAHAEACPVCQAALADDPGRDEDELQALLLADDVPSDEPEPPGPPRRAVVIGVVAALLVGLVATVGGLWSKSRPASGSSPTPPVERAAPSPAPSGTDMTPPLLVRGSRSARPRLETLEARTTPSLAGYNGPDSGLSGLTRTPLSDGMAALSNWSQVNGSAPILASDPNIPQQGTYLSLNNGLVRADLNQTLTQDFSVSFKARHSAYRRSLWVGLFNAAGTQGYAALWDSAVSGPGVVSIRKFNLTAPLGDWLDDGDQISPGIVYSGHTAVGASFAVLKLTWDNRTDMLTLSVDGVPKVSVADPSFSSFSRVYLRGNDRSQFDDLTVSVGSKLQAGTLIDDRFTGFATQTDPTAKADQTWKLLSGGAVIQNDGGERRLKSNVAGTRLSSPIASGLDTPANEPVVNVAFDVRRGTTSGDGGGLFLVDDSGAGYGFVAELAADGFNRSTLWVYATTDFGATMTSVGSATFSGVTGTGNHIVCFSWNRAAAFGAPAGRITATIDGRPAATLATTTAYSGFTQAVARGFGTSVRLDNLLVSSVPANAVNLRTGGFGVVGDGVANDQAGIDAAVTAARTGSKVLYAPPGTYAHSSSITLDGVKLIGVGNATHFRATSVDTRDTKSAIILKGTDPALRRVRVSSPATLRAPETQLWHHAVVLDHATGFVVTDVQTENSNAGGIMTYASTFGNTVNNLVLGSKADGIHHTNGTSQVQVFNNDVRNTGDDQIAVVSYDGAPVNHHITAFDNTTDGQTWGRGLTVIGGTDVVYDHNEVKNAYGAGVHIVSEWNASYHTLAVNNVVVRRNVIDSPRGLAAGGAVSMRGIQIQGNDTNSVTNVTIDGNTLTNTGFHGIAVLRKTSNIAILNNTLDTIHGNGIECFEAAAVTISGNTIRETWNNGIYVDSNCTGAFVVRANHLTNINASGVAAWDAIRIGTGLSALSIFDNVYDETPGNTYNVERFIQCDLPAAKVSKGNNTTTTGEPEYWAP